jgi:phosphatidate cytidylyltransferase
MIFANILALIALKELLNMNMIKFVSVPGLISAVLWQHNDDKTNCTN